MNSNAGRAIALLGMVAMVGCATYRAGAPKGAVDVIAHRGASAYAPENTLAAFKLADEMDADWFELDCTLSRDGEVVVIHDNTVDRTTDGQGAVKELDLARIRTFDAGAWKDPKFAGERLPTLGEALDLARGRIGVYIEIKDSDDDGQLASDLYSFAAAAQPLAKRHRKEMVKRIEADGSRNLELTRKVIALVRERRMQRQVVIQSFSPIVCAVALAEAPRIRVELLGGDNKKKPEQWTGFVNWGYALDVDGFNPDYPSLTPERLAEFHKAGKTVSVWTVDEPADMRRLAEWGVDGLITNRPDVCRGVLNELRTKK